MSKVTTEELKSVVEELNEKICDPAIKMKDEKKAIKKILQAAKLIEKGDEISKDTMTIIKKLKGKTVKKEEVKEEKKEEVKEEKKEEVKEEKKEEVKEEKKKKPAISKPKGVGVLGTIQKIITEKATSKAGILKKLVAKFPDRDETSMGKTINAQLPNRMAKERGIKITEKDGKYSAEAKKG